MASLLERIARGAGEGLKLVGQMGLEEQRQARLDKMKEASRAVTAKEGREFETRERKASETFRASESALDRKARVEASKVKGAKPDTVKFRDTDDMSGKTIITYESGKREEYDPQTDTTRILGKGKGKLTEESKGVDVKWGKKMAARESGYLSFDESDFPLFKSEEKAAEAAAQFRSNARRAGTIDEFNTKFAKKGWSYIQELAGDGTTAKPTAKKTGEGLMSIFKDFDQNDYSGIANQIVADPKSPEYLKKEARDYLSGAS